MKFFTAKQSVWKFFKNEYIYIQIYFTYIFSKILIVEFIMIFFVNVFIEIGFIYWK